MHFSSRDGLVQVTFMQLYKELRRGKKINHPKAWSLCVLRREIGKHVRTHLRTSRSHEQLEVEAMDALPGDLSWASQPGIELDDLTKLFSVLTQREEEVLLLRMEPLKYREIAAALGISSNTVNTLLARALRKLQKAAKGNPTQSSASTHAQKEKPKPLQ